MQFCFTNFVLYHTASMDPSGQMQLSRNEKNTVGLLGMESSILERIHSLRQQGRWDLAAAKIKILHLSTNNSNGKCAIYRACELSDGLMIFLVKDTFTGAESRHSADHKLKTEVTTLWKSEILTASCFQVSADGWHRKGREILDFLDVLDQTGAFLLLMPEITRLYSVSRLTPGELSGLLMSVRKDIGNKVLDLHNALLCVVQVGQTEPVRAQRKQRLQSLVNLIRTKALSQKEIPGFLQSQQESALPKPRVRAVRKKKPSPKVQQSEDEEGEDEDDSDEKGEDDDASDNEEEDEGTADDAVKDLQDKPKSKKARTNPPRNKTKITSNSSSDDAPLLKPKCH